MKRILQTQLVEVSFEDDLNVDQITIDKKINEAIIQINKDEKLGLIDVVEDIKLINNNQALIVYSKLLDDL